MNLLCGSYIRKVFISDNSSDIISDNMRYPTWKNLEIRSITSKATQEFEELGILPIQVEGLLERSFPCPRGKRKRGIYEQCVHRKDKLLKIVLEEMTSWSGKKYWRVRHVGLIGFKKKRFR